MSTLQFCNCTARLVAPEGDPLRLKHVVLDITIKIVALTVKLCMVIVINPTELNFVCRYI
jgi:hypothetical protein